MYGDPSSTNATFDDLAPILVGAFAFFLVLLISGISLVNERTSGTLGRMLVTPVKRTEIVIGLYFELWNSCNDSNSTHGCFYLLDFRGSS